MRNPPTQTKIDTCTPVKLIAVPTILAGFGQYSDNQLNTPADALRNASAVVAAAFHTCAIKSDGLVACWGYSSNGADTAPAGLGKVKSLAGTYDRNCAILEADDTVRCWGDNSASSISDQPADLGAVKSVGAGWFHTCAVTVGDVVRCWGRPTGGDDQGQTTVPANLQQGNTTIVALTTGKRFWVVRFVLWMPVSFSTTSGLHSQYRRAQTQHANMEGMKHYSANLAVSHPVLSNPPTISPNLLFRTGRTHNCVLLSNAAVQCWGDDQSGQASPPPNLGPVAAFSAGSYHTCVILAANRTARCFGSGDSGPITVPKALATANITSIAAADHHTCLLLASGAVRCFGNQGPWSNADPQYNIPKGNCALAVSAGEWVLAYVHSQVLNEDAGLQHAVESACRMHFALCWQVT